ncbi:hypothetical protein [Engelhardtia mirabilis]|uniref:Uncharacterized protein n=1 Tax=Engelhardtia mirabilis TaxID=2528011 RepID=A0A518BQ95_9BACT|nr:hypothetical protein Pla133_42600 [Planctomycetes bacterium Pla133]QDV03471.1 hypothetical protein Pla86_42590 [Planctomycetes bacterium Pla86]
MVRAVLDAKLLEEALGSPDSAGDGRRVRPTDVERDRFVADVLGVPFGLADRAAASFNGLPWHQRRILFGFLVERRALGDCLVGGGRVEIPKGFEDEGGEDEGGEDEGGEDRNQLDGDPLGDGVWSEESDSAIGALGRALLELDRRLEAG